MEPTLIDLEDIPELEPADVAGARAAMPKQVQSGSLVDHAAVKLLKRGLLETAFGRFWEASHEGERAVKWAMMKGLLACNSRFAAFMITDLYGMKERFNVPGTVGGANWRVRMPFTVADMSSDPARRAEAERLRELVAETRR